MVNKVSMSNIINKEITILKDKIENIEESTSKIKLQGKTLAFNKKTIYVAYDLVIDVIAALILTYYIKIFLAKFLANSG